MNSLHTSLPQKTPIRGVALRPQEETCAERTVLHGGVTTTAIAQRRATLFARSMDALRKATRGEGMMPHVIAFCIALFAVLNMAQAQATYFWVGANTTSADWGQPANWSLTSSGPGGAGVPGFPYGNVQDVAIFDGNTNVTILTGFPTNGAAAAVGQIRLLNSFSSGPQVTFGGGASTVATIRLGGTAASTNSPLFVGSLCRLFIDQNITMDMTANVNSLMNPSASIFGDLSIRIGGTVTNSVASRFRIEDGGSLRMSGGTFTAAGATSAVEYSLTGNRGSLVYDRDDNTTVIIPAANDATEVPTPGTAFLGNLVIRRPIASVTTFTNGGVRQIGGTLIVDGCALNLPNAITINLAASRMVNNGNIFAASTTFNTNLVYRDLAAAAGRTPLNPTVSDLSFGVNPAGIIPNGQYLGSLTNNIATMNLSINSDLNIVATGAAASGITLGDATVPVAGGQITIPATRTLTLRLGTGTIAAPNNTGRLIIDGTFAIATGATLANNNTNANSPLAGLLINPGGRIQLNGSATITGTANGAFYNGPTATLEYLDRNAATAGLMRAFTGVAAYAAPAGPRTASTAELPADMRGAVTVNRLYSEAGGAATVTSLVALQQNTVMNGPLTLAQGTLGLNSQQLILNGTVTSSGGFISGNDAAGTSALVYNSIAPGTLLVTTATTAPHGNFFNYMEINNTGSLSLGVPGLATSRLTINGATAQAAYGLAGVSNYNGQLRFNSTGNLILNGAEITFSGAGAANTTPAAQGGHIPVTSASVGAIFGDGSSQLIFLSNQIRSFPRFAPGGQVLNELRAQADGVAAAAPGGTAPTALIDYMVSLRTVLQTNTLRLQNNAILQLGNNANLTVLNPPDLATATNIPNNAGNFIDASQGGSLQLRGYLAAGNVLLPMGVSFVGVNGAVLPSRYRPAIVSNSVTTSPGENYTVTVTSNIVNLVPSIPSLANNSMRGQWNISSGSGMNGAGGVLTLGWGNTAFPLPAPTVAGDNPAAFAATLAAAGPPAGINLTTIRRWTGTTYSNVLPTTPVVGLGVNARRIQATYNGALSNTVFIVSNELFPVYWVGGSQATGDWGVAANWASSSAGTGGSANPPGVSDWAVFDKAQAPRITTNIPPNIQQLSVIEGANVTLAPTDVPRTLSVNRDLADNDNILIGPNSRLAIGTGGFPFELTVPLTGTANGPNTSIFGTLSVLGNSTYNHKDGNSTILIANGGTLHIGAASGSSVPATTTGFQKLAATTLRYGSNTNSTPPYTFAGANDFNTQNATLLYEDAAGGTDTRTPTGTTGELPAAPFPGNIVINKTLPGARFRFNVNYQITSTATLRAGILDLTTGGVQLDVGTATNPGGNSIDNPPGSRTLNITGSLPDTGILGDQTNSILRLNGAGTHTLQFVPNGELLNTLTLEDLANPAPNSALTANLVTNLRVTTFNMTNARTAVSTTASGMIVNPNLTFRVDGTGTITSGRMLVDGTLALPSGGAMALPAAVATGGIDIGTTGTLNIINNGNVTGTPGVNPVRYLNAASRLLYSAEGMGFANKLAVPMVFPQIFNGSLVIDKNFSAATTTNTVDLAGANGCRVVTQGTVELRGGDLRLMGFMFKVGSAAQTLPAAADLLNNTISPTARILPGGGRIFGDDAAGTSSFVYNGSQNGNLFLGTVNATGTHLGRFLNKLEINGPATLTLSTGAVVNIESGGTPACDGTYQGTLRLDNSVGNLALNGSSLRLTGTTAPAAGQILTNVTSGTISGDNLPGTSIAITSQRIFNVQMAFNANSLRQFSLNPAATVPAVGQRQISLLSSMTADAVGITRNIVSLMSPTVNLTITGAGANATSGNLTAAQANFGLQNNNFIDLSPGGSLTMTIPNNTFRTFPIGVTNNTQSFIRPAPLMIGNQSGLVDTYTISLQRGLTFQNATYPDRVNAQWTIAKSTPAATNQLVHYGWHTEHETGLPGFFRQNTFAAQWNGASYSQTASSLSSAVTASAPAVTGPEWGHTVSYSSVNMAATNPFVILTPPSAIILAADSLAPSASGGFNTGAGSFGFLSPNGGNLTITSGEPFTLRISAFDGLNQRSPVRTNTFVRANLMALPGGTATFSTTGTGGLILGVNSPIQLLQAGNSVSATTTNLVFDWLNPSNQSSTQATLILYDQSGAANALTSVPLTITILAPPPRSSTIAYSQVQNSSTGTQGFNGGGLGQFNIIGGVQFPIDFGFYSRDNFLLGTNAATSVLVTVTPLTGGAMLTTTGNIPITMTTSLLINPAYVNGTLTSAINGRISPIVNWTNAGMGGGVVQGLLTLTANPGTPFRFSTSVIVNIGTGATVPARLGYSVNSGDISDPVRSLSGINNANFTPAGTNPIITGVPFPLNFAAFAQNGMVVRPETPTQVELTVSSAAGTNATFSLLGGGPTFIASTNGIGSLRPTIIWTNPGSVPSYGNAVITLRAISGQTTLLLTTANISIFTTGSVAAVFAMSQSSTNGTQGISLNNNPIRQGGTADPVRVSSGTPFNVDYGFYNAWGIPTANYPANSTFTLTVTPPVGQDVTIDGNTNTSLPFAVQRGTLSNITLNWRNPTGANPPPIDVTLRIDAAFAGLSTTVTIRLSSSANAPAFLGLSQLSSTSSVGINNGSLNVTSGLPFNVDAGLFDLQGALTRSLTNIGVLLTVEPIPTVPGSGSVTIAGNTGGVFVNQSGIRFNNILLNWNNPTSSPSSTQVRLRISGTSGGAVLSTSAIVTVNAGNVFPRISNLSPAVGGPGTEVQITGVNFTGVNAVSFGGIPAASFRVAGDGLIIAVAPPGVNTGAVTVSRPAQGAIPAGSNGGQTPAVIFTTGLTPVITELVPSSGGLGARILIRGINLFSVSDIRIADIRAVVDPDPNLNNTTTGNFVWVQLTGPLLVTTGSFSESRSGPVTMATLGGVITSSQRFTYNPPPVITSITPNTAVANGQPVSVIIRGTGFNFPLNPSQSDIITVQQSGVFFNVINNPMAISPALRVSVQSVTPTEIRATISGSFTNLQGQRYVYVQNQDAQSTFVPFQLTPNQPPVITSITPNITTATGVAFEAIVNGSNFFGASGLTVTARTAAGVVSNLPFRTLSPSQVAVTIPIPLNSAAQNLTITLQNSDGQSAGVGFTVRDPGRPQIFTVSPSRAVAGSSTMTVTITGSGFFLNAIPSLGNTELQVLARSTTSIVAVIPADLLSTFANPTIGVRNPLSFSTSIFFPIGYPAPTVSSVLTASGSNQGQPVTAASIFPFQLAVNGSGFRIGVTATFNGQAVTVVSTSPTQVVIAVPGGLNTPGVFPVALSNADGQNASGLFTIGTPNGPIITSISPREEVAIGQPFVITLEGRNFSVNAQGQILAGTQVLFNGVPLAILQASSTRLVAQVPAGLNTREGNALVEAVNSDLQRTSIPLTVGCAICPIVRSFTPTTVRPTNNYGHDVTFTFRGSNLSPNSTITIGGSPLRIVSGSDSVITAIAPQGFFFGDGRIVVTNPDGRRFTLFGPTVGVSNVVITPLAGRAYPNPVDDMLTFETDITSSTLLRVRLSDVLGRTVTSFEQQVQRGRFTHQLDVSGLSAGVYIFEMTDGQRRFTEKIIKR
ncbi:MAG: T9SS C-terminal target domain-containing protein [Candidatus Kapaibacterium sp.]|nr:MAG: T9SS C-terminal target domain-containing protein [Candidatus Kapabacteria bacterium]